MKKYIEVSSDSRKVLMKIFGCTRESLWAALSFKSDSETAKKIRTAALRGHGGRVLCVVDITDGWVPNCQTEFRHDKEGVSEVCSTFTGGVKVTLDCHANTATLTLDGKEVRKYWNVDTASWGRVLFDAEQLSIH